MLLAPKGLRSFSALEILILFYTRNSAQGLLSAGVQRLRAVVGNVLSSCLVCPPSLRNSSCPTPGCSGGIRGGSNPAVVRDGNVPSTVVDPQDEHETPEGSR